jgi:hypothetical protein
MHNNEIDNTPLILNPYKPNLPSRLPASSYSQVGPTSAHLKSVFSRIPINTYHQKLHLFGHIHYQSHLTSSLLDTSLCHVPSHHQALSNSEEAPIT